MAERHLGQTLPHCRLPVGRGQPTENYMGIHFFSPVDKMPLVEIIMGEKTGDVALAKAFDYTKQIKKTPIVVNDSPPVLRRVLWYLSR